MAIVYVDNQPYQMNPDENLLHGCLSQGLKLPYFCWHPALGSLPAYWAAPGERGSPAEALQLSSSRSILR